VKPEKKKKKKVLDKPNRGRNFTINQGWGILLEVKRIWSASGDVEP